MDISRTIHLLGDLLGQVISELESPHIFDVEERIRAAAKAQRAGEEQATGRLLDEIRALPAGEARPIASAFATYFDLVNLAEEDYRVMMLNAMADEAYPAPVKESIGAAVAEIKRRGVSMDEMGALLEILSIELVLTAHPTEARRRTVLSKLQRIARLVADERSCATGKAEHRQLLRALHAQIATLWLTDRARTAKPTVTDEVRTGLYFVESVFWQVLPRIYRDLQVALDQHYPGLTAGKAWLRLASWIGGDRDGNPYVTAEVTAETLRLHRGLAVESHRRTIQELARQLSMSQSRMPAPQALLDWFESRRPLPAHVAFIEERYAAEPYRLVLSLLASDLAEASREDMRSRLLSRQPHQAHIHLADLSEPLSAIESAVPALLGREELADLRTQLRAFGLHAARLDIREDSARWNAALSEVLLALRIAPNFDELPAEARLDLLTQLLRQPAPQLSQTPGATPATAETWALLHLIGRVRSIYGNELLGPVIISMTRSAADILTVLLLAHWAGCADGLHITPLFETIDDLQAAPHILGSLFSLDVYREHLATCQNEQTVMIGYSDSNKDGGYLMANWALYQVQEQITQVARQFQVPLTIFHGRGGSIARGGGPAYQAIRAQPAGSVGGRFRLTEQGEIIASRYANPSLAHRHLEQIVSAVLLASAPDPSRQAAPPAAWRNVLNQAAQVGRSAYRDLVFETPGFIDFWQTATPLDEIKRLTIGSRPAARHSSGAVNQIRAIPWVFSWMQSRFNLPGWYSLGSGLAALDDLGLLREMYAGWPFFQALLDNTEMSLLKADMNIAALYVDLVPDKALGQRLFQRIRDEFQRTVDTVLAISGHAALLDGDPVIQKAIQVRNPYIDPLNYLQVEMLRRLRAMPDPQSEEAEALREVIVLTINGIAGGLRNTG